jgi:hypothetical protein
MGSSCELCRDVLRWGDPDEGPGGTPMPMLLQPQGAELIAIHAHHGTPAQLEHVAHTGLLAAGYTE